MPDSIFIKAWGTCFVVLVLLLLLFLLLLFFVDIAVLPLFFCGSGTSVFLGMKEMESLLSL